MLQRSLMKNLKRKEKERQAAAFQVDGGREKERGGNFTEKNPSQGGKREAKLKKKRMKERKRVTCQF